MIHTFTPWHANQAIERDSGQYSATPIAEKDNIEVIRLTIALNIFFIANLRRIGK